MEHDKHNDKYIGSINMAWYFDILCSRISLVAFVAVLELRVHNLLFENLGTRQLDFGMEDFLAFKGLKVILESPE